MSAISFAQSLSIAPNAYYYTTSGETCTAHFNVTNVTNEDVDVIVTRTMNYSEDEITSTFCWGETCYTPSTDISLNSIIISAGESFDGFSGYVYSMGEEETYEINYCFSLVDDPSDKVCTDIIFTSSSQFIGVEELENEYSIYPNPANDILHLDNMNSMPAAFVLYDMLGNKVFTDEIVNSESVSLSSFDAGIYFYTFSVQEKETEIQKLIITH